MVPRGSFPGHVPRMGLNVRLATTLDAVSWLGLGPGESGWQPELCSAVTVPSQAWPARRHPDDWGQQEHGTLVCVVHSLPLQHGSASRSKLYPAARIRAFSQVRSASAVDVCAP